MKQCPAVSDGLADAVVAAGIETPVGSVIPAEEDDRLAAVMQVIEDLGPAQWDIKVLCVFLVGTRISSYAAPLSQKKHDLTHCLPRPSISCGLGSRLFGTHRPDSDWDYFCIVDSAYDMPGDHLLMGGDVEVNLYHRSFWQRLVEENVVWAVMCDSLPKDNVLMRKAQFTWDLRVVDLK